MSLVMTQTAIEPTDEALAAAAQRGDQDAFTRLVGRYRHLVQAYAFARLGDVDAAQDAAQEAFVRAFQALGRFDVRRSWAPYLMRVLRNHCQDVARRSKHRAWQPLGEVAGDGEPGPAEALVAQEERAALRRAVDALPERLRTPIEMHYGSGSTCAEIALALNLPESTVIGRMAGGIRALRRKLGAEVKW